ncbi:NAD(P)-dependent dehydrogenase (short-subunit alcohol dehydrogenase family) [Bradyrhizobium japonicum]
MLLMSLQEEVMPKVWLITGAGRGLGRSIVSAALQADEYVLATGRDRSRLLRLESEMGGRLRTIVLDVTDADAARSAVDFAIETFGRLDVLVNNAGYGRLAPFEQTADPDFRMQMETNFYGVVNLTRAALPLMRIQRSGYIINVSSVGGRVGTAGLSAYQAAKWAVGGFTEVIAKEAAAFGVKVLAIEPGGMRTDWVAAATSEHTELLPDYDASVGAMMRMMKGSIGREMGDPAKVADVIVSLTNRDALPAHLLLGAGAMRLCAETDAARQAEAELWAATSASTDFSSSDPHGSHG